MIIYYNLNLLPLLIIYYFYPSMSLFNYIFYYLPTLIKYMSIIIRYFYSFYSCIGFLYLNNNNFYLCFIY